MLTGLYTNGKDPQAKKTFHLSHKSFPASVLNHIILKYYVTPSQPILEMAKPMLHYWLEWSTCFPNSIFSLPLFFLPHFLLIPHFLSSPFIPTFFTSYSLLSQILFKLSIFLSLYHSWPKPVSSPPHGSFQHTTEQEAATANKLVCVGYLNGWQCIHGRHRTV